MKKAWTCVGIAALTSVALLGLHGCGGGGSSSDSSSSTTTTTTSAPSITTQPSSVSVSSGSSATFSVVATGSGTLSYQWYKDSTAISGATSSSYTISSAASSDAGSYYVIVTNSAGTATSSTVTLTVTTTTSSSCDSTYVTNVMSAITTLESALGTSLTSSMAYSASSYTTSQLNVYKTRWSNLPPGAISFTRPGITISQLSGSTVIAAFNALASTALGSAGYTDFKGVLAADDYLGYTKNANGYGAALYHVAVVGTPSTTGSWTLMFGGHHMAFNINFNAACVYPTPHHIGVEPRTSFTANSETGYNYYDSGTYQVLAAKGAAMLAIFTGLDSSSLSSAFLTGSTFGDILIGPVEANTGSYSTVTTKFNAVAALSNRGVLVSSLTSAQQALVTTAISSWVNDYDSATASRLLSDYEADYGSTYVAWANASGTYSSSGPDITANATYMRIDGPRVWIEIALQNGVIITSQTHYHMIWRDKSYDYYNELGS